MEQIIERPLAVLGSKGKLKSLKRLIFSSERIRERTLDEVFVSPGFIDKLRQAEPYHVFPIPDLGTGKMKPGELFLSDEFASTIPTFKNFPRIPRLAIVAVRNPSSESPLKPYALEVDGISNLEEIEGHKNALLTIARLKGEDDAELLLLKENAKIPFFKGRQRLSEKSDTFKNRGRGRSREYYIDTKRALLGRACGKLKST